MAGMLSEATGRRPEAHLPNRGEQPRAVRMEDSGGETGMPGPRPPAQGVPERPQIQPGAAPQSGLQQGCGGVAGLSYPLRRKPGRLCSHQRGGMVCSPRALRPGHQAAAPPQGAGPPQGAPRGPRCPQAVCDVGTAPRGPPTLFADRRSSTVRTS